MASTTYSTILADLRALDLQILDAYHNRRLVAEYSDLLAQKVSLLLVRMIYILTICF